MLRKMLCSIKLRKISGCQEAATIDQKRPAEDSNATANDHQPAGEHYEHVTEHYQPQLVVCESTTERIDRDDPAEYHAQTIVLDQHAVQEEEPVVKQNEPSVQADHAVQDTDITELQHDPEAEHQKHVVEHSEETFAHPKPAFDQHENAAARPPQAAEDHLSPTEDKVHIHQEYREYEQPITTGKLAFIGLALCVDNSIIFNPYIIKLNWLNRIAFKLYSIS
jgi:hypothetical protein